MNKRRLTPLRYDSCRNIPITLIEGSFGPSMSAIACSRQLSAYRWNLLPMKRLATVHFANYCMQWRAKLAGYGVIFHITPQPSKHKPPVKPA